MIPGREGKRHSFRQLVEGDLEILPMLNLFIALIPMLLISAVFLEVTVIDMHLPPADAAAKAAAPGLDLTLALSEGDWTLSGRGLDAKALPAPPSGEEELSALLGEISRRHPEERGIVIVSQPDTRYDRIILAMDIAREAGWPEVSLYGEVRP